MIDETILQVFPGDEYTFNRGPYGGDLTDRMCETRILRFDDPPLDDDPQGTINEIVRIWRNQFEFDVDDTTEVRRAIADVPGAGILTVSSASPQGTIDIQAVTAECAAEDVPFENTTMRVGG